MVTLAMVNSEFHRKGIEDRLHKGRGYFYFTGPKADHFTQQGVYVNRVNQLTISQWLDAYKELEDMT